MWKVKIEIGTNCCGESKRLAFCEKVLSTAREWQEGDE
jgi:hypothetical protein